MASDDIMKKNPNQTRRAALAALLAAVCLHPGAAQTTPADTRSSAPPTAADVVPATLPEHRSFPALSVNPGLSKAPWSADVQACVKEGDSCAAPGAHCCAGFICAGINGSICISSF